MTNWTVADIPDQRGRTAIVTGGTEGLGFQSSLALARAGAEVVLAARNAEKGALAVDQMHAEMPNASVRFEQLDLASLTSVADFATRMNVQFQKLDLLINNAGIMTPPERRETADGFELQLGTNFLGHFALTAQLIPLLRNGDRSRVVTLSSFANRRGAIAFDDLQSVRTYQGMTAYAQSKLADLMFAFELERRSREAGWGVTSLSAHPGLSRTSLISSGPGANSPLGLLRRLLGGVVFQSSAQGAVPALFAATSPDALPGAYYGPDRFGETQGNVRLAKVPSQAKDEDAAMRLWNVAEQLTALTFPQPVMVA